MKIRTLSNTKAQLQGDLIITFPDSDFSDLSLPIDIDINPRFICKTPHGMNTWASFIEALGQANQNDIGRMKVTANAALLLEHEQVSLNELVEQQNAPLEATLDVEDLFDAP